MLTHELTFPLIKARDPTIWILAVNVIQQAIREVAEEALHTIVLAGAVLGKDFVNLSYADQERQNDGADAGECKA